MQLLVLMDFGDNELFPLRLEETMHQSFFLPPFQVPRGEKRKDSPGELHRSASPCRTLRASRRTLGGEGREQGRGGKAHSSSA